jgi:hypothetical protein
MRKKEKNPRSSSSSNSSSNANTGDNINSSNTQFHPAGDNSSSSGGGGGSTHRNKNGSQHKSWYWYIMSNLDHHGDRPSVLWLLLYVLLGVILGMILGSSHFFGGDTVTMETHGVAGSWSQRLRDSLFRTSRRNKDHRRQRRQDPTWLPPSTRSTAATTATTTTRGTSSKGNGEEYHQILRALVEGGEISEEEEEILVQKYGYTVASAAGTTTAQRIWQQQQQYHPGNTYTTSTTNYYAKQQHQQQQRPPPSKTSSLPIVLRTYSQAYYTLREMIIREDHGYVHTDLGILSPAPCGAERGLGMVSSRYHECQVTCSPGTSVALTKPTHTTDNIHSKEPYNKNSTSTTSTPPSTVYHLPKGWYPQEEILLRIPLSIQMTRLTALKKLRSILPADVESRAPLEDLDDFILLALQLAHEHGSGRESPWHPYIATLPATSQCGYAPNIRSSAMEMISILGGQYGLDVNGWPAELHRAYNYADQIASSLAQSYGPYIAVARGVNVHSLLQWSLCHVSSRAVGAQELDPHTGYPLIGPTKTKSLRLVPLLDLINHDVTAGMAHELLPISKKKNSSLPLEDGAYYTNIQENERGAFIVRNIRHGKAIPLAKGQELLINYNVPEYSALDWFLLMSFVPPERMERWVKVESAFPRVRIQPRVMNSKDDATSKTTNARDNSSSPKATNTAPSTIPQ